MFPSHAVLLRAALLRAALLRATLLRATALLRASTVAHVRSVERPQHRAA